MRKQAEHFSSRQDENKLEKYGTSYLGLLYYIPTLQVHLKIIRAAAMAAGIAFQWISVNSGVPRNTFSLIGAL
jgi:hypothetical protein